MLKRLLNFKIIFLFFFCAFCYADDLAPVNNFYPDKTKLVTQQIELLKNRITQAKIESDILQKQDSPQKNHADRQQLAEADLDISVAKSNLDSVEIELA